MLSLTLAQMRQNRGRLASAGLSILIGTAFVTLMILAGSTLNRATLDAVAARYGHADLVVSGDFQGDDLQRLRETPGVAAADASDLTTMTVTGAGASSGGPAAFQAVLPAASDPRLTALELVEGRWPAGPGEIAVSSATAERLDVQSSDLLEGTRWVADASTQDFGEVTEDLRITGVLTDPTAAYAQFGDVAVVDAEVFAQWRLDERLESEEPIVFGELLLVLDDGSSVEGARVTIATELGLDPSAVVTPHEHAAAVVAAMSGGQDVVFSVFVIGFAVIALVVAGLVISNTFQVLVAQRVRTLALLRAVGAERRQIRRSVLTEAVILGAIAAASGVLLAILLGQIALWTLRDVDLGLSLPAVVPLTWQALLLPTAAGVLVTLAAASVPARAATRVPPVAALQRIDDPVDVTGRPGRLRLLLTLLLILGGAGLLGAGVFVGYVRGEAQTGLLLGLAGGLLSFAGVTISAVFWVPRVTAGVGRLLGAGGTTARLAAANTLHSPRRTAATSTALLIGVTLVAMLATGAASARPTAAAALDAQYPVDVQVISSATDADGSRLALDPAVIGAVRASAGVEQVADMSQSNVTLPELGYDQDWQIVPSADAVAENGSVSMEISGLDPALMTQVVRDPSASDAFRDGELLVSVHIAAGWDLVEGQDLLVQGPAGEARFTVRLTDLELPSPLASAIDMARLDPEARVAELWVALSDDADAASSVTGIRDALADSLGQVFVAGAAPERVAFDRVIDGILGVVVGLLAVSVVIALIGVANTLSLSVHERRRESATMRAIGLTAGQLRRMLAIEGMLIAGVGTVLGLVLGLLYGWAGSLTVLGVIGPVTLTVPWTDIAVVAVLAMVAGLLASVLPGRAAARMSPVHALSSD